MSKKGWEVICIVRVLRKCGHRSDHSVKTTLGKLRKLMQTECNECGPSKWDAMIAKLHKKELK